MLLTVWLLAARFGQHTLSCLPRQYICLDISDHIFLDRCPHSSVLNSLTVTL